MPLLDSFKTLFKSKEEKQRMQYAKLLNGYVPIFSQFGRDVYASDVVQDCVNIIASEISKLQPRHIRTDTNGMQKRVNGSLNRLFKFGPNETMTTHDFLEKTIWLLYKNYNAFIYPVRESIPDDHGKSYVRYTAFYPLDPTLVTFLQDPAGKLYIEMSFMGGEKFTIPYADIIHLRKRFSVNGIMGGGIDGQPDNEALLKVLEINDTVLQGLDKAIRSSLNIRGIIKINSMMDDDYLKAERRRFEEAIETSKSGLLPIDFKGDYVPLEVNPKVMDKDTLDFLQNKILFNYGVSIPIFTGSFTDEEYQAFYEKTLEPLIIALGQAFSKIIFTPRELDVGNEIVFYQKDVMYLSTKAKLDMIKITGEQGLLSDNQKLALLGYPPVPGGERITQSLNYMDKSLISSYQLGKARIEKQEEKED